MIMAPAIELPLASWSVPRQEASCPAEDQGAQPRRKKARAIPMRIAGTASNYSVHFQIKDIYAFNLQLDNLLRDGVQSHFQVKRASFQLLESVTPTSKPGGEGVAPRLGISWRLTAVCACCAKHSERPRAAWRSNSVMPQNV
jgi:hypothetical protein